MNTCVTKWIFKLSSKSCCLTNNYINMEERHLRFMLPILTNTSLSKALATYVPRNQAVNTGILHNSNLHIPC